MFLCFSGTKHGMTLQQKMKVQEFILKNKNIIKEIRHGDKRGGDEDFHNICTNLKLNKIIFIHPTDKRIDRALCKSPNIMEPKNDWHKKYEMIDKSNYLLLAPNNFSKFTRLGVWTFAKIAKEKNVPVTIIYPDGTLE